MFSVSCMKHCIVWAACASTLPLEGGSDPYIPAATGGSAWEVLASRVVRVDTHSHALIV